MATLSLEAGTTLRIRPKFRNFEDLYVVLDPGIGNDAEIPFSAIRWCVSSTRLMVPAADGFHISQFSESLEQTWRRGDLQRWLDASVRFGSIKGKDRETALTWFGFGAAREPRQVEVPPDFVVFRRGQ